MPYARRNPGFMLPAEFKRIRLRAGLTQAQLARIVEVDRRTVGKWEALDRPVSYSVSVVMEMLGNDELPQRYLDRAK